MSEGASGRERGSEREGASPLGWHKLSAPAAAREQGAGAGVGGACAPRLLRGCGVLQGLRAARRHGGGRDGGRPGRAGSEAEDAVLAWRAAATFARLRRRYCALLSSVTTAGFGQPCQWVLPS